MSHNKLTDPIHAPVCMGDAVVCNFVDCDFFLGNPIRHPILTVHSKADMSQLNLQLAMLLTVYSIITSFRVHSRCFWRCILATLSSVNGRVRLSSFQILRIVGIGSCLAIPA